MREATDQVEVFHERCMGAGNCADVAPKYFDQSNVDGTVVVRKEDIDPGDRSQVDKAIDICPVGAIAVKSAAVLDGSDR
jgi:ferredoxin